MLRQPQPAPVTAPKETDHRVTRTQFGDDWPYNVDEAHIVCTNLYKAGVIRIAGRLYAMNGIAKAHLKLPYDSEVTRITDDYGEAGKVSASSSKLLNLSFKLCKYATRWGCPATWRQSASSRAQCGRYLFLRRGSYQPRLFRPPSRALRGLA